jgi:hypothetical protein
MSKSSNDPRPQSILDVYGQHIEIPQRIQTVGRNSAQYEIKNIKKQFFNQLCTKACETWEISRLDHEQLVNFLSSLRTTKIQSLRNNKLLRVLSSVGFLFGL